MKSVWVSISVCYAVFCPSAVLGFAITNRQHHQSVRLHSEVQDTTEGIDEGLSTLCGGDYCGLSATFSPSTGALIPIPDHLVPESMLEWGQAPSSLEVIVSETLTDGVLERQTVQILPEVGCAVDNMDTIKTEESLMLNGVQTPHKGVITFQYKITPDKVRSETVFGLNDSHRIRILLDIQNEQILSPIRMMWERKTSKVSSGGTIADGGGLDGRTVSRLMGDEIDPSFAEKKATTGGESDGVIRLPHSICIQKNTKTHSLVVFQEGRENKDTVRVDLTML